jgi:hypothetical protein
VIVECPSGFTFELRALKTREANILADRQAAQKGMQLDQILGSIWVANVDRGPYTFAGDKPDWEQVLTGDRFWAHMMARKATHGNDYDFRIPCSTCRATINWTVQLDQLPVRKLKPEDAERFRAGNRFQELGPDGKQYTFHLMTGKHEKRAQQILKNNRTTRMTASLRSRIDEIEGVKEISTYLDDLDFNLTLEVLAMLDAHDCGVETDFEVFCDTCGATSDVTLPFDQVSYWRPTRKAQTAGS